MGGKILLSCVKMSLNLYAFILDQSIQCQWIQYQWTKNLLKKWTASAKSFLWYGANRPILHQSMNVFVHFMISFQLAVSIKIRDRFSERYNRNRRNGLNWNSLKFNQFIFRLIYKAKLCFVKCDKTNPELSLGWLNGSYDWESVSIDETGSSTALQFAVSDTKPCRKRR